jgi:hypothetical protein
MHHRAARHARRRRRIAALAVAAGVAAGLAVTPSLASATPLGQPAGPRLADTAGGARHAATAGGGGSKVTVTGPHMYDPKTKKPFPTASTVTVSQDANLVNQFVNVSWTGFTPSHDLGGKGYQPGLTEYPVEVSECQGTAPTDLTHCYGADSPIQLTFLAAGPSNEVYGLTSAQGTGSVAIQIATGVQNSTLGCDQTHACSLLILPIEGGDPGPPAHCTNHTEDTIWATAGFVLANGDPLVSCALPSGIVVPLHFAPTAASCGFRSPDFSIVGSPMLERAMNSWTSGLCRGARPVNLAFEGTTSEPQATTDFLDGANDVALTTEPASGTGSRHFTYAPVGISATVLAYWMDNPQTFQPYTDLKLDPRLVAKLVTTSYNYLLAGCTAADVKNPPPPPGCNDAVEHNPETMFDDPEFRQLNPGIHGNLATATQSDFPTVLSGNSDMTFEVTRWIAANPDATSFLAGFPDPWGMHVDLNYLGTHFPVEQFTSQDSFFDWSQSYSPTFPLAKVVLYQADNWDPGVALQPNPGTQPPTYPSNPAEPPGTRDLVAILDEGDAAALDMPTAALLNHAGKYVTPTLSSMAAAVSDMTANSDGTVDDNEDASNPAAYPLTMVVYAMVPTSGISKTKAAKIAQWLDYVAGPGQVQGTAVGQLPPGYLPLPASMRKQTQKAAFDVAHQTGNQASGGHHGGSGGSGGGSGTGSGGSSAGTGSSSNNAGGSGGSHGSSSGTATRTKINAAYSSPDSSGAGRLVLPILLVIGALLALAGPTAVVLGRPGGRAAMVAGWHRVLNVRHLPASLLGRIK